MGEVGDAPKVQLKLLPRIVSPLPKESIGKSVQKIGLNPWLRISMRQFPLSANPFRNLLMEGAQSIRSHVLSWLQHPKIGTR